MGTCKHTPTISERGLVDLEFGFAQTTCRYGATGVGHLLDKFLGFEKLVDPPAQGNIFPADNFLSNHFESKGSIADPSVEIVGVNSVRAGNDDSSLMGEISGSNGTKG